MDGAVKILLEYGLIGALFIGAVIWCVRLMKENKALNDARIEDKNLELARKDKDNELYISVIEKSLNALTQVEKTMFEHSTTIPVKVAEVVKKENEPLIIEFRRALENRKDG